MKKKKFNSHLYTEDKFHFNHQSKEWYRIHLPDGYLFAEGIYETQITKEDLPEYYISGYYHGHNGWLDAKHVVHMDYAPNKVFNHAFKYDSLYIYYTLDQPTPLWANTVSKYSFVIGGGQIPFFVKAVKQYAGLDTSHIEDQIRDKLTWFKETYPDFYELEVGSWKYEP